MTGDAELVLRWLTGDIARRGGTGRRLSKIQIATGLDSGPFRDAVRELEAADAIAIDRPGFGFVYAVPL